MGKSIADKQYEGISLEASDTLVARGTSTAPTIATTLTTLTIPETGRYEFTIWGRYGTATDVADNMALFINGVQTLVLPIIRTADAKPIPIKFKKTFAAGTVLTIKNPVAGAATVVYSCYIFAEKISS